MIIRNMLFLTKYLHIFTFTYRNEDLHDEENGEKVYSIS